MAHHRTDRISPDIQREIGQLAISEELARFCQQGFELSISESAFEFLVRRGIHKVLGARPMKGIVQKLIGDALRAALKDGAATSGLLDVEPAREFLVVRNLAPNLEQSSTLASVLVKA